MRWTRYLLYPTLVPTDVVGWLFGLFLFLCFGAKGGSNWPKPLSWNDGSLIIVLFRDSRLGRWATNTGAFTLGHCICVFYDQDPILLKHERVHVKQLEMAGIAMHAMSWVAAWPNPWAGIAIWALSPVAIYLAGGIVALCYGGNFYRDNPDEVAAYDRAASVDVAPPK